MPKLRALKKLLRRDQDRARVMGNLRRKWERKEKKKMETEENMGSSSDDPMMYDLK